MSVINTNITSLIGQSNLSKSQNALQTSMERLSSGLRINSAKDDAAGQAIANRMTAQITGLAQAQRNANDGISVAQTAEGALNQVNDNLQRVRELAVQAQNETNSSDDLKSIQDEIGQRLSEINRISKETSFNGVDVLASNRGLEIQVGANDGEKIEVNLKEINAQTLGLSTFNVDGLQSSKLSDALTDAEQGTTMQNVNIQANGIDLTTLPQNSDVTSEDVYRTVDASGNANGYAVLGSDGSYYELAENTVTGQWVWDSSSTALTEADIGVSAGVDVASGPVTTVETTMLLGAGSGTGEADTTALAALTVDGNANFFGTTADDVVLARRNDVQVGYAAQGSDNNWYAVDVDSSGVVTVADGVDPTTNPDQMVQISSGNVGPALTNADSLVVGSEAAPTGDGNLFNVAVADIPAATGNMYSFDGAAANEYAVEADGKFYVGTFDETTGEVAWDSSTPSIDPDDVDTSNNISELAIGNVQGSYTGLEAGETLHSYTDSNGDLAYVVKSGSGNDATYTKATLGVADAATGNIEITKETGDDATLSVRSSDPLDSLDAALNQVDSLRSELGAVQNRFEDAITNLQTNETNLSAARSRIEDADYAVEVANMTRAQILQQAGTSVLAQANQIPQNVLSLLG